MPIDLSTLSRDPAVDEARHEIDNETNQHEVLGEVIAFIHTNRPDRPGV